MFFGLLDLVLIDVVLIVLESVFMLCLMCVLLNVSMVLIEGYVFISLFV